MRGVLGSNFTPEMSEERLNSMVKDVMILIRTSRFARVAAPSNTKRPSLKYWRPTLVECAELGGRTRKSAGELMPLTPFASTLKESAQGCKYSGGAALI